MTGLLTLTRFILEKKMDNKTLYGLYNVEREIAELVDIAAVATFRRSASFFCITKLQMSKHLKLLFTVNYTNASFEFYLCSPVCIFIYLSS